MMRRVIRIILGILVIIIGLSIFLYPDFQNCEMNKEVEKIIETVKSTKNREHQISTVLEKKDHQEMDNSKLSEESQQEELYRILTEYNEKLASEGQMLAEMWDFTQSPVDISLWNQGSNILGYIEIPDISLKLPLYVGATEQNMSSGAVVLSGTSMPIGGENSNCVIAAHRGWSGSPFFRDIDKLVVGSEVFIHNLWESLSYCVTGASVIHESDAEILQISKNKDMITLFSCYPYMSVGTDYRLVIFCEREELIEKTETIDSERTVSELVDKDLKEKEIDIGDTFKEEISQKEDQIRKILPVMCVVFTLLIIIFQIRYKR